MRLWKALFYCYWMSDKVPVQRELAERLAALINVCSNKEQVFDIIFRYIVCVCVCVCVCVRVCVRACACVCKIYIYT